ncbi:cytochrome B [Idiomarina tyrosinivorans]|uniref:Cytochrome B n=1 Tax=Idiomarina tyrosinivorans TaxID=1445662 RepID=A0A432ZTA5_9GAMM|nr:COX15/CtaA family protein [Idiomarina tyrosinivorans]RUO81150.1 cytochrome B [Idiomarina tyrosinivorans]
MKTLVKLSLVLAFCVIVLGAYTRLTDSGLGCPDWPGCYGYMSVPSQQQHVEEAQLRFPDNPIEHHKAWSEMIHRYFAGSLGLLIAIIALLSWRKAMRANALQRQPWKLPTVLLALVLFQAALGMWTVTLNLQPLVVMGHLLGGFTTFSLLYLLHLRLSDYRLAGGDPYLRKYRGLAALTLVVVFGQIALGGWVAANYAALACTELPFCEGNWWQQLDISGAFSVPTAESYQYGTHDYGERMTMHIAHRIGAIITTLLVLTLVIKSWRHAISQYFRQRLLLITLLILLQVSLGISNVLLSLPLPIAVAHNAVAALLLLSLVGLNYNLSRKA